MNSLTNCPDCGKLISLNFPLHFCEPRKQKPGARPEKKSRKPKKEKTNMTKLNNKNQTAWFDVDRTGLAKILRRKGVEFAVFELIQNAWDEAGVTSVDVTLRSANQKGCAMLTVEDNSPDGFKDLRHAYTLFAESEKKGDVEKRGRFNLGEKLVLSLCEWAKITTTKGTVVFDKDGRSESKAKRKHGTIFEALIHMSDEEQATVHDAVKLLIPQPKIETRFNAILLENWQPAKELEAKLPTEISDHEGGLHKLIRKTVVRCYPLKDGEAARIYEMGIPIVEHDCAFHCDIMQKVPLTIDRENVTVQFVRLLRTAVFNATHDVLTTEDVNHEWAQTAIESGHAKPEAVEDYMGKRFGELRASYDPSDPEANNAAVANGYTVVHGSMLSREAWKNVRGAEAITPAGQLFPSHPDKDVPREPVEETPAMIAVREYAQRLARLLLGCDITVRFCKQASNELACWGMQILSFNVKNLGASWFNLERNRLAVDDLIIHEFGHHYESNHLSKGYNDALSRLAAKAMELGRAGKLPK